MIEYICPTCFKNFGNRKDHFEKHKKRKFPCKKQNYDIMIQNENIKTHDETKNINPNRICIYCHKIYARKFCCDRHMKICNFKDNVNMGQQLIKNIEKFEKENNQMKKNITINNINNGTINNNTIVINHRDMDYSLIDRNLYKNVIMDERKHGKEIIIGTIENIHVNEKLPCYHNIVITDKNRKHVKIYNDGKWNTSDVRIIQDVIDEILYQSKNIIKDLRIKASIRENDRLDISEKYIDLCDDENIDENNYFSNPYKKQRNVDFQNMVYEDTINLFHDNKKMLLKSKR